MAIRRKVNSAIKVHRGKRGLNSSAVFVPNKNADLDSIKQRLADSQLVVGIFGDTSKYIPIEPKKKKSKRDTESRKPSSNVEIAVIHEFGLGNVPQRPFLGNTVSRTRTEFVEKAAKLAKRILNGDQLEKAFNILGAWFIGEVKKTITEGMSPPNAPSTIVAKDRKGNWRRGKSKKQLYPARIIPLIDTGQLLNSITWAYAKKSVSTRIKNWIKR